MNFSKYLNNPWRILRGFAYRTAALWPDRLYLKIMFRSRVGYPLSLDHPKSFNEKLQWLKLESKKHPEYTQMVDKVAVKDYVASIVGEKYIIPTLGVWNSVDEIDWDSLPNQFVVKSAGDSGGIVVCKDKSTLNIEVAKKKLYCLGERDYCKYNREYPYRNVPHRYIAESYIEDESGHELKDYKIFCFGGEPFCTQVDFGRFSNHKRNIYNNNWEFMPFMNNINYPYDKNHIIEKPKNFDVMLEIAKKLSKGIPHVRVDLYNINGKVYFGELTFFHASGMGRFSPEEWDYKLGEYIHLPID